MREIKGTRDRERNGDGLMESRDAKKYRMRREVERAKERAREIDRERERERLTDRQTDRVRETEFHDTRSCLSHYPSLSFRQDYNYLREGYLIVACDLKR